MAIASPIPPALPVIRDAAQLDAYLAACASGRAEAMLATIPMDHATWLDLAGGDGDAAWQRAQRFGFPLVDMSAIDRNPELRQLFPDAAARRLRATPLLSAHGYLALAIDPTTEEAAISTLGFVTNQPLAPLVATTHARMGRRSPEDDREEDQRVARQMGREPGQREVLQAARDDELAAKWPMIQTMRSTMTAAIAQRASDVHIRPGAKDYEVLFRIDGNMVHQRQILPEVASLVVNRIKVFAGMDIAEHRRAQDGRGSFKLADGRSIDLRVSVVPTVLGESVVIRLLDTEESLKTIDSRRIPHRSSAAHSASGRTRCSRSGGDARDATAPACSGAAPCTS